MFQAYREMMDSEDVRQGVDLHRRKKRRAHRDLTAETQHPEMDDEGEKYNTFIVCLKTR